MTATPEQPSTVTLPSDLMHRLLDRLESQEKAAKRETTTSRMELVAFGLGLVVLLIDTVMTFPPTRAVDRL
ncbi:MAG: hypothetical protein HOV82_21875 [Streptomyces sp.]|nr:hypothetical protein [Streptomyces sp.]